MDYATIIKVEESVKDKNTMEKIILCDVQKKKFIQNLKIFSQIYYRDSGLPGSKI